MVEKLLARFKARGCQLRVVPVGRLDELKEEIESRHRQGGFDEEFYRNWIVGFDSVPPEGFPEARSIILAAVFRPQRQVVVAWDGEERSLAIPPSYFEGKLEGELQALAAEVLAPAGYRVVRASLPKKLLAVRSGLAEYGRNNITYVPGMGSFFSMVAMYSDLPAGTDRWRETKMMERCNTCSACLRHCPTGAITSELFLLRAERCLPFYNERPGSEAFPAWIDPSWHNCLIGCLACQTVCPVNKELLKRPGDTVSFSEEETKLLLQDNSAGLLPSGLIRKLERAELAEILEVLPRNLRVMLEQGRKESGST